MDIPLLELKDTGISALTGPSGSGKTSFLRILSGLDSCSSLEWIFHNEDLAKLPVSQRRIGFVFQSLELFPNMTAYENIRFGGLCSNPSYWKQDLDFLVKSLDISHCQKQKTDELSRGEAQRVALARSLITRPRILFLDEPFSSLDEVNRKSARKLIQQIVEHYQIPVLLVSHDPQDVQSLAHTVISIQNGHIVNKN